eukprot:4193569-Pyramimonas_sp.AAC.1
MSSGKSHRAWKDACANQHRIDYILADHDRAKYVYDSSSIEDIETMTKGCQEGLGRDDLAPLQARARWRIRQTVPRH